MQKRSHDNAFSSPQEQHHVTSNADAIDQIKTAGSALFKALVVAYESVKYIISETETRVEEPAISNIPGAFPDESIKQSEVISKPETHAFATTNDFAKHLPEENHISSPPTRNVTRKVSSTRWGSPYSKASTYSKFVRQEKRSEMARRVEEARLNALSSLQLKARPHMSQVPESLFIENSSYKHSSPFDTNFFESSRPPSRTSQFAIASSTPMDQSLVSNGSLHIPRKRKAIKQLAAELNNAYGSSFLAPAEPLKKDDKFVESWKRQIPAIAEPPKPIPSLTPKQVQNKMLSFNDKPYRDLNSRHEFALQLLRSAEAERKKYVVSSPEMAARLANRRKVSASYDLPSIRTTVVKLNEYEKTKQRKQKLIDSISALKLSEISAVPPLDKESVELVNKWMKKPPSNEFVSEFAHVRLTTHDLRTLGERKWLNDTVIDFYLALIVSRARVPCYAFSTHFFTTLSSKGYDGVKRWTIRKKVDVTKMHYIFVPINIGQLHWVMAIIDNNEKKFAFYDSMSNSGVDQLMFLEEYMEKEFSRLHPNDKPDYSSWTFEDCAKCPQQQNGYDCGVFSCKVAERLSQKAPLNFSQKDMPMIRKTIAYDLITAK